MLLYYITDRLQFAGDASAQQRQLLAKIAEASAASVDYIQLREKDLPTRDLEVIAREAVSSVEAARQQGSRTRLLINSRSDIAIACGADGVHLTSTDISAGDARALWMHSRPQRPPVIGVSCHSKEDVQMAYSQGADFAVLAPIFGKQQTGRAGIGLGALSETCSALESTGFPVLALGGVTAANAAQCLAAGAVGLAGIRLFQENPITELLQRLRG